MTLAVALTAIACQRELPGEEELPTVFGTVSVNLGTEDPVISTDGSDQADTKSLITIDAEDFVDAYLFCFNASTKSIETYDDGLPVATYTTAKTFDWALPINKKIDVWVVANPGKGNAWKTTLQNAVTNASLKESDLTGDNLMFTCASSSALKDLETSGAHLPMSGVVSAMKLTSPTQSLNIKVKRLFAKYNIYFDMSVLEAEGYTVKSTYLASSKSNTEVPFFYFTGSELGGYKQSTSSKLTTIDRNSEADLQTLENGEKVTLYFLENCQGTISGASSWSSVYDDLGAKKVQNCSYMEVGVNISRHSDATHEAVDKSYAYRIYLGESDMKSNFDVKRNLFKTIKLKLPKPDAVTIKDGFEFTNSNSLSVVPGESISVPFETSESNANMIDFKLYQNGEDKTSSFTLEHNVVSNTIHKTDFDYEGTLTLKAKPSANEGTYELKGSTGEFMDTRSIAVHTPVILTKFNVEYSAQTVPAGSTITLQAFIDTYKDGVRTSHVNITNMSTVNWELVYGPSNTTLTGTTTKTLKRTTSGGVTVNCSWDGTIYGSSVMDAQSVDMFFYFTSSTPTSKTINFEISTISHTAAPGTYYKVYADSAVPCDILISSITGVEYTISAGSTESNIVTRTTESDDIMRTILRAGTTASNGVQTTYYDSSTNTNYVFSW